MYVTMHITRRTTQTQLQITECYLMIKHMALNLDLCSFHSNKLIRAKNSCNLTSKVFMRCCSEAHLHC